MNIFKFLGRRIPTTSLIVFPAVVLLPFLVGWSGKIHQSMTTITTELLPQKQLDVFGTHRKDFIEIYCLIPDLDKSDPNSGYARYLDSFLDLYDFPDVPDAKKRLLLHAGDKSNNNFKIYEYYTKVIIEKLKTKDTLEAMKYLGTFVHYIQDTSCPAHPRYGPFDHPRGEDKQSHLASLHFFKRFMPVPDKYADARLHGVIDKGGFDVRQLRERLADYQPQILGSNLNEVINALQIRHEQMMSKTDRMLIPMLQAYFNEEAEQFGQHGLNAAELAVRLSVDYVYTVFQIADLLNKGG